MVARTRRPRRLTRGRVRRFSSAMLRCESGYGRSMQPRTRNVSGEEAFRALLCGVSIVMLLAAMPAHAGCGIGDLGMAQIATVRNDATLILADGREVRLAGVEPGPGAQAVLDTFKGRAVRLTAGATPATDRYGRTVAFASADQTGLQEDLLSHGAA